MHHNHRFKKYLCFIDESEKYQRVIRIKPQDKIAQALITISNEEKPPQRFIAGADAVATAYQVSSTLKQQTDAYRELSGSLAFDDAKSIEFSYSYHLPL